MRKTATATATSAIHFTPTACVRVSQLLTTGVDAPTVKNIVICRVIGSMSEFKQIIGRGTRVAEEFGKTWFSIIDYTGCVREKFADPDFDGEPEAIEVSDLPDPDEDPYNVRIRFDLPEPDADPTDLTVADPPPAVPPPVLPPTLPPTLPQPPRRFYFDGGTVEIIAHVVYELDADGTQLRVVQLTDYAAEKVRTLFPDTNVLRDAIKSAPLSDTRSVPEIVALFGGPEQLRAAVNELQQHLYAA